jgi:hypothetical protein
MKQARTIFMVLIMILICCSYSMGQSSSGIGIKGNVGAAPIGIINNGANVYPVGEYGASVYPVGEYGAGVYPVGTVNNGANTSLPLQEFQCNLISSCGIFPLGRHVTDGAIVYLGGVRSGATVSLGGVKRVKQ